MFVHVLISFSSHCSLVELLASGHHCHKEIAFSYQQQKASESGVRESLISQWLGKEGGGGGGVNQANSQKHSSPGCFTVQLVFSINPQQKFQSKTIQKLCLHTRHILATLFTKGLVPNNN